MPILLNSSRNIGLNSSGVVSDKNPLNPAGSFGGIRLSSNKFAYRSTYARLEAAAIAAARRNNAALWFIPDSITGVYQDSAGTTLPALNAPIGLLLDRSYGTETVGPEQVVNGTFDTDTSGWSINLGGTLAWGSSGVGTYTSTGTNDNCAFQALTLEAGKTYQLQVDCYASGSVGLLRIGTGSSGSALYNIHVGVFVSVGAPGRILATFVAPQSNCVVSFGYGAVSAQTTVQAISVREVIAAANLGPELVTNGTFSTNAAGWDASSNAALSSVSGTLRIEATNTGAVAASQPITLVVGRPYRVSCKYVDGGGYGTSLNIMATQFGSTQASQNGNATSGTYSFVYVATAASMWVGPRLSNATAVGQNATFDEVSVREVLGYHASQATAANKPTLVRVPRKLGPDVLADKSNIANGGTRVVLAAPLALGRSYAISGTLSVDLRAHDNTGVFAVPASRVVSPNPAGGGLLNLYNGGASPISIADVSVREVLEWSYAASFDGSNDLMLSTIPAGGVQGSWGVAMVPERAVNESPFGTRMIAPGVYGMGFKLRSDGAVWSRAAADVVLPAGTAKPFAPIVLSSVIDTTHRVYANGAAPLTDLQVGGNKTDTTLYFGQGEGGSEPTLGKLVCAWFSRTALPDADRIAIERFAAYLSGANYVG